MLFFPFEFMFVLPMSSVQRLVDHIFGSKTVDVYREANGLVGPSFFLLCTIPNKQFPFYLEMRLQQNRGTPIVMFLQVIGLILNTTN